jgi:hypothetical protein
MSFILGLHEVIARLVYEKGKLSPREVDVRFDAPKREFVQALTRPTLDFYLFDVRENTELRHSDPMSNRSNGVTTFRLPPRRFDLRFLVSALTSQVEDEQLLLWHALAVLLKHATFPAELSPPSVTSLEPTVSAQVRPPDEDDQIRELWSAFEVHPRPALVYVVTAPLDLDIVFESPLVFTRTARYHGLIDRPRLLDTAVHIGGEVRDAKGDVVQGAHVSVAGRASAPSRTDEQGRFVIVGVPEGKITLEVARVGQAARQVEVTVPSDEYELVIP